MLNPQPALQRGDNALVFPWNDPLACSTPEGFSLLPPPQGPFVSGPWEPPLPPLQVLLAASISYQDLDQTYGGEGRATGAKATLVKPLQVGPKFIGSKMKYSSFKWDPNRYDRSHLIPREFGGRGVRENIVPLYKWINQETKAGDGPLRAIEKQVKAAVA